MAIKFNKEQKYLIPRSYVFLFQKYIYSRFLLVLKLVCFRQHAIYFSKQLLITVKQMFKACKQATNILLSSYEETALISGISDVIVVSWQNGSYRTTPFIVCFGSISSLYRKLPLKLYINDEEVKIPSRQNNNPFTINKYGYVQPFQPSLQTIKAMNLKKGKNIMKWVAFYHNDKLDDSSQSLNQWSENSKSVTGNLRQKTLTAQIYYFGQDQKIMISDFDGTMTKTDIKGLYSNFRGRKYLHEGYEQLIRKVVEHGYRIVWITMRSITMYSMSKKYINEHIGCQGVLLPQPEQFFPSLKKEVLKKTGNIKTNMLKTIRSLFPADINPFVGGLGNRQNDAIAYLAAQIPIQRIYLINRQSQIHKFGEMRILNYQHIVDEMDGHFPLLSIQPKQVQNNNQPLSSIIFKKRRSLKRQITVYKPQKQLPRHK